MKTMKRTNAKQTKKLRSIGPILVAIRQFSAAWTEIRAALDEAIPFLRRNGKKTLADILANVIRFGDAIASVGPLIPASARRA